jgi:hypothetical protein
MNHETERTLEKGKMINFLSFKFTGLNGLLNPINSLNVLAFHS